MSVPAGQRYPSPLRYPGGKGKVANYIKLLLLENDLVGCEYVEPYAGGASVALSLLFEDYADRVHINDLNPSVYAFWQTVLGRTEDLCERVLSVNVDVDEWHRQRAVQEQPQADVFDLGFSTFFLNRCARSGIIRGGVIGGLDQDGPWKIDARFNREDMVRRIRRIARYRDRITVTGLDTADYISDVLPGVDAPFVYLDPPYYVKGEGLYQDFYVQEDHERIAGMVESIDVPWLVSYDSAPSSRCMKGSGASPTTSTTARSVGTGARSRCSSVRGLRCPKSRPPRTYRCTRSTSSGSPAAERLRKRTGHRRAWRSWAECGRN